MKKLNEYSSKELKVYSIILKILAIPLFLMSLLLCLAVPAVGIIGCVISCFLLYMASKYKKESRLNNVDKVERIPQAKIPNNDFPEVDEKGKRALALREADIYGVGRKYNNIPAQDIIAQLKKGDKVVFEISKNDAVKVLTEDKKQIGYLPEWKNLNDPKVKGEVYDRLVQGATVLGKVKSVYKNNNGTLGVVITICRYAK